MCYKLILTALAACLLSACNQGCVCVQSEYITYEDLASYQVGTPDPKKECPDTGQRLIVRWALPKNCFNPNHTQLLLTVRFGTGEEEMINLDLHSCEGRYIYDLLNDDYFDCCGILTYRAIVTVCGKVVDEWLHQIWTDRIRFNDFCPFCNPTEKTETSHSIGQKANEPQAQPRQSS